MCLRMSPSNWAMTPNCVSRSWMAPGRPGEERKVARVDPARVRVFLEDARGVVGRVERDGDKFNVLHVGRPRQVLGLGHLLGGKRAHVRKRAAGVDEVEHDLLPPEAPALHDAARLVVESEVRHRLAQVAEDPRAAVMGVLAQRACARRHGVLPALSSGQIFSSRGAWRFVTKSARMRSPAWTLAASPVETSNSIVMGPISPATASWLTVTRLCATSTDTTWPVRG